MSSPDNWLENAIIFGVYPSNGGGGGGGVTPRQVQEFAFNYEPATGVNDAFVVVLTPAVTVLTDGLIVSMSTGLLYNETDTPTLQINTLPPTPIVLWGGVLAPGDIEPNASYLFIYNESTNTFQLINPSISTANAFLVQNNAYNSAIDTGAANAYAVTLLVPPQSSFTFGFPVYMRVSAGHDNTGPSTLTVNGVTDAIVLNNGAALPAGALIGNRLAYLLYNGNDWVLMNPAVTSTGFVQSVTGANVKQVIVNNTDPENPILSLPQDINVDSDVNFNSLTTVTDIIVSDVNIGQGPFTEFVPSNFRAGYDSLKINESGMGNTAIGSFSLTINTTGFLNTAVGKNTGATNNGNYNTFVGGLSGELLGNSSDGDNNTLVGAQTGIGTDSGYQNFLGGSNNTWLGCRISSSDFEVSGTIAMGALALPDPGTGVTVSDFGPSIALGSASFPVGFRGDGTAYPAGSANYWRMKVNGTYYKLPILPDATALEWPAGPGTIALLSDIPSPGGGLSWLTVSGTSQACAVNFGYISLNAAQTAFSLPAVAPVGSVIAFQGHGAGGWTVNAAAGQTIFLGIANTAAGGSITSDANSDNMYLLCVVEDAEWRVTGAYSRGLIYV